MNSIKSILYASLIGLMIVIQLLHPVSAFADGEGTPPPTSTLEVTETPRPTEPVVETAMPSGTPEITVIPEETNSPTDVPAVTPTPDPNEPTTEPVAATPIPTEFATPGAGEPTVEPVATTPAPTAVPTDKEDETKVVPTDTSTPTAEPVVAEVESTVEETSLLEVLSEIPAETEVVVLDESGQPEPLATVEAAEAISSGDPIWCPEGVTPGDPSCSASFANLSALVEGFVPTGNGTIYIAAGSDSSTSAIVIDGNGNWSAASNYSLTIQGGWGGATNSEFPVPISITNWNNGITIQNVNTSSINLSNVTANQGNGITVNNTNSNVKLENISIYGAFDTGLIVHTSGEISGAHITSTNNQENGADLLGYHGITLTGGTFNGNKGAGMIAYSDLNVSLINFTASQNGGSGLSAGTFSNILLENTTANNNGRNGAELDGAFTFKGQNTFNNNAETGLKLVGFVMGPMNVTASGNKIGVYITNGNDIYFTGGKITNNGIGLYVDCAKSINFDPLQKTIITGNTDQDIYIGTSCPLPTPTPTSVSLLIKDEFALDCSKQAAYPFQLPNGDLVSIFCPFRGTVSISRIDNTSLPGNLPVEYIYASAFTLDILQQGVSIPVITEGGYVKSSFVAQPLQPVNTYTVLYWDPWIYENGELVENPAGGSWVPLKDFLLDGDGNTESFDLFPGTDDPRKVISGVNLVNRNGSESIEVSTNFPGIFVLAQR